MIVEMTKLNSTKLVIFQRSATAPVGMVQVVSMNTIWKRNVAATAGVNIDSGSKKPLMPKRPKSLPNRLTVNSLVSVVSPKAEPDAAHLQAEADEVEADDADGVDEEVHAHRVRGVLRARQARLHQGEAGLHEHDEEARHHRPDDVEGDLRVGEVLRELADRGFGCHRDLPRVRVV